VLKKSLFVARKNEKIVLKYIGNEVFNCAKEIIFKQLRKNANKYKPQNYPRRPGSDAALAS
jgi:hypothetical protein